MQGEDKLAYIIGIDIGTSGTKAVLANESGETVVTATYEYPLYQPKPGWAEQSAADWMDAAYNGIRDVILKSGGKKEVAETLGTDPYVLMDRMADKVEIGS